MSGRKQHFIPQSLLKGFGRPGKGAKVQVIAYTHDRGTFAAATDGVAAEREFYSPLAVEGQGETLDDKITGYETSLAHILSELRSFDADGIADAGKASEFVTHLVVRNDHLRKFMSSAATDLFGGFAEMFSDQDQAKAMLGLSGPTPSAMVAEQLANVFADNAQLIETLGMSQEQFNAWAFGHSQANFGEFHAQMLGPLQQAFGEALGAIAQTAAEAQRRSLGDSLSPEARIDNLKKFEWRVAHVAAPLILPDCVAVATNAESNAFPLMLEEDDETDTIYVPLSSDRLLIGSKARQAVPNTLNNTFAECSWDFFIARDRTPELEALRPLIRSCAGKRVQETVRQAMSGAIGKIDR